MPEQLQQECATTEIRIASQVIPLDTNTRRIIVALEIVPTVRANLQWRFNVISAIRTFFHRIPPIFFCPFLDFFAIYAVFSIYGREMAPSRSIAIPCFFHPSFLQAAVDPQSINNLQAKGQQPDGRERYLNRKNLMCEINMKWLPAGSI